MLQGSGKDWLKCRYDAFGLTRLEPRPREMNRRYELIVVRSDVIRPIPKLLDCLR